MSVTDVTGVTEEPLRGHAKRRARTRSALLAAAREFLAEGRDHPSIEEITTRAGVGFGSFFNHFPGGKDELFEEATLEVLDAYAAWLLAASADLDDPAEAFARSFRLSGRLALDQPEVMAPLLVRGTEVLLIPRGLRDAALTDLTAGVETGRFVSADPEILLVAVGGALLGLLRLLHADAARATEETVDVVAASALRLLGIPSPEVEEIVARPLPDLPDSIL